MTTIDRGFPKVKYESDAADAKCVTVKSAEEEAALGDEWLDGHEYWTAQRVRAEKPAEEPTVTAVDLAEKEDVTIIDPQLPAADPEVEAAIIEEAEAIENAEEPTEETTEETTAIEDVSASTEEATEKAENSQPRKKGKGKGKALALVLLALSLAIGVPRASAQQGLLGRSQTLNSTPAASSQATVSFPATPDKWVFDQVCFSGGSTTAPALTQLSVNIRDGATGAGTVLASFMVIVPAATGQNVLPFCTPLGITGSFNTAATAEWSAALTNEFEQITLYVHKAQ